MRVDYHDGNFFDKEICAAQKPEAIKNETPVPRSQQMGTASLSKGIYRLSGQAGF